MKKLLSIVLIITLVLGVIVFVTAVEPITVKVDGIQIVFPDAQPFIDENSRTLVPVRFVAENLGCTVDWQGANQVVSITRDSLRIALKIGENWAVVNDARKEFDTKAVLKEDRTFVPLRFVSEALGKEVNWHGSTRTVAIGVDKELPEPTPSPYEDFELVSTSGVMPEGFIQPKFRVVHNLDKDEKVYFDIEFVNLFEYKNNQPDKYQLKIECINYPQLNVTQGIRYDGTLGSVQDLTKWINLGVVTSVYNNPNSPVYMRTLPYMYYTSAELEKDFKLYIGMEIEYRITFMKGNFKQIYTSTVKIRSKL